MPTKPISRKLKKRENRTKVFKQTHKTPVPAYSSVGLTQPKKVKGKTSFARRVFSLLVAYLVYNYLWGCGSPFDQTSQKPVVCEVIDPIKLDIIAFYQSDFCQHKVHPHLLPVFNTVIDYYDQYGAPQQAKLVHLYDQHGKPALNKAHVMYQDTLLPTLLPYLDTGKRYLNQAKVYADPYVAKATQMALLAQDTIQYQCWPAIQSSNVTRKLKSKYDQYLKQYVDQHLKPVWVKYSDQVHLDQWLAHVLTVLPQRAIQQATSGSLMAQTKTPTVSMTTQDISITQKVGSQPTLIETVGKYGTSHEEDSVKQTSVASATEAVVTDNHVVPVPEEKELFEQNRVPPQSPTHVDAQAKDDVLEQKIIKPVKENVETVKENAKTEKQVIEEKVEEAADENIVKPLKQVKDHVEEARDAAKNKTEDVKEIMKDNASQAKESVEESINEATKQVKEAAKEKVVHAKENAQESVKKTKDEEDVKEAKDAVEDKVQDTKETVQEAKNMVEDKVSDANDVKETIEAVKDKAVHVKQTAKEEHIKDTIEPEVIEFDIKKPIEEYVKEPIEHYIKEPIQKVLKKPKQQQQEDKETQPKEQDASPLTKEQVVVSDDSSFVVQKEQLIAKDIPPIVIDQFVLEDNEPLVP